MPQPIRTSEKQPKICQIGKNDTTQASGQAQNDKLSQQQHQQQLVTIINGKMKGLDLPQAPRPPKGKRRRSMLRNALCKLNPKRCCQKTRKLHDELSSRSPWDDMNYTENQNSVGTLDLFKYASLAERLAIALGMLSMWYAASWQPISVFILAIMASLMGQYSKQTEFMLQLTNQTLGLGLHLGQARDGANSTGKAGALLVGGSRVMTEQNATTPAAGQITATSTLTSGGASSNLHNDYENFALLRPLYPIVDSVFELLRPGAIDQQPAPPANANDEDHIRADVHDILRHEANLFLRKSFEINGSAFLLALTQLLAFFLGLSLITWAAKKQASRLKILYFSSSLHQEVTWFEAINKAGGSGSSLNSLVERYEDGIGVKLALLCYFLGHIALFAATSFWQLFSLAAFCMPFVLVVGLIIAYLSELQADSIGDHALFAKRSLELAEEIVAAIRTVFAFNGQQKEITRYSISLQPVYRKSLIKHLYTALNTSLSKFSIFACFAAYCFYAMRLFPPYDKDGPTNKATVLAVMRGAEVSIVNILISIPFMEALQQAKGSIARIYAAIERCSKLDPSSDRGLKPTNWQPSISFRQVQFGYAERSGPTKRRSTLPFLNLPGSPGSGQQPLPLETADSGETNPNDATATMQPRRRRSIIAGLTNEFEMDYNIKSSRKNSRSTMGSSSTGTNITNNGTSHDELNPAESRRSAANHRASFAIKQMDVDQVSKERILNKFNLEIKPAQSVALVGPSGSGKSTVLSLVQRLYDISGGKILIGQNNLKDLNISWLRNQIGIVAQEARLFDMSITDNIKLGLNNEQLERYINDKTDGDYEIMQQVIAASKEANAHDFITKLPNGYNTKVGSGGVQLSGGQKQRIAIARALIRKPKILLLDECTSALDTESETMVKQALQRACVGRTTLTVAHRLDTIKYSDLIVVMDEGQVVESGTHDELMKSKCGLYKSMYEEQLKAVKESSAGQDERHARSEEKRKLANMLELSASELLEARRPSKVIFNEENLRVTSEDNKSDESDDDDEEDEYDCDFSDDDDDNESGAADGKPTAWQLWQFIDMPKWSALAATLTCLLSGLILPMNLIAHSYLFSAFAYNDLEQLGDYLHVFGLVILSFSSLVFIVSFLQVILPGYVGEKLSVKLRVKMMDALLSKPMFYFDMDSNSAGALCDRFNSYIAHIQNIAGTRTATMLEAVSTLAAGAFFGFGQNLQLSLFCLSFAMLVLLTTIVESRIEQREASLLQRYDARLAHMIADALSNIKTIASLNKERFFIQKFTEIIEQREFGTGPRLALLRTFLTSLKFVMPAMSWSASMYYGCHLLVDGRIDLQIIFIVCPVVLFAVNDTFRALVFLPELLKARKSIKRLYRMNHEYSPQVLQTLTLAQQLEEQNKLHAASLAAAAETEQRNQRSSVASSKNRKSVAFASDVDLGEEPQSEGESPKLVNRRLSTLADLPSYMGRKASRMNSIVPRAQARGRICFRNVEFAYPNRPTALVLDGFTLNVEPGESVALVGGSGSGKSTCVQILEKFYDYHAGHITLDGNDLRLVESNWVRSQIGLVSQEATLLSYTIGDNIRYGDNDRFVSMDEVVEAARTANIHDFIMSLPDQYDTELSSSSYSSSQLSGGQRQRIAIARALVANAPILIFDEATSALDTRNETVVQDALNKARRGRTNLTIAHRLATIRDADKIAVMRDGKVVELGRHEDLLRFENGHYRKLWEQQEGSANSRTP